ncbi:MAG TPA: hypothetical protein VFW45_18345 [Candidatus Polarisedimenticolia bacterium]|nr:hypothetical protein [Candidatus Polarisedimenticolia bacterium]
MSPQTGQQALVIGNVPADLLRMLGEAGVQMQRGETMSGPVQTGRFDLILEERPGWKANALRPDQASFLSERGRWVVALKGSPAIGVRGWWVRRQMRRRGLGKVESYYAHSALWSPVVLVPLDQREPFDYFLRLTISGGSLRRWLILTVFQVLVHLRIHAGFLPNCIVVARRTP